jgi:hypothetical protein
MSDIQDVKDKIAKLLALAKDKGANENEAAVAMNFAMKMMLQHNLQMSEFEQGKAREVGAKEGASKEVDNRWEIIIAQAAGVLYGCRPISIRGYGQEYFKFVGRADNNDASMVTFDYLTDQVERLYKSNLPKGMTQRARAEYRRTFKEACACRVYARAKDLMRDVMRDEQQAQALLGRAQAGSALVVQGHFEQLSKEVDAFMAGAGVKIKTKPMSIRSGNGSRDGSAAGNQVNLRQQVR